MDLSSFYNQFREETLENVRVLTEGLLALEQGGDAASDEVRDQVHVMFRAMHTVKGSARLLGFNAIGGLAHAMEDVLAAVRTDTVRLDRALTDELLRCTDALLELTNDAVEGRASHANIEPLVTSLQASLTPIVPPPEPAPEPEADAPAPEPEADAPALVAEPDAPAPALTADAPAPALMADAPAPAPAPAPVPDRLPPLKRPRMRQTVRVRTDRLDRLINLTGELVIGQQFMTLHNQTMRDLALTMQHHRLALVALEREVRQMHLQQHLVADQQRQLIDQQINSMLNVVDQMYRDLRQQSEQFSLYANQHHLLVDDLEREVITTRLLPVASLFTTLPRAVRELAHATGKEVLLTTHGEETELDRKLLELLADPLLHVVRNAVDHGIEPPDERIRQGKPPQGHITVQAEAQGGEVRLLISDDGRGMDPQAIRETARRKGLISADEAVALSDQEALELVFLPGFTTASLITDISGRGVGMDVVRTNITELSGHVLLHSQPGQGTTLTLVLPLTLVTTRIVLVEVGSRIFALPAAGSQGIIWVHQQDVRTVEGRATIAHNGRTLPVLRLADVLGLAANVQQRERTPALLVGNAQRQVSLLVDRLIDEREAVIKPLGPLFEQHRHYTGAVQLGDGTLVLLLNPALLARDTRGLALPRASDQNEHQAHQPHLLVADDSFTTRELIRSILHSAGYTVTAAVDGQDALDKLRRQTYDLVVSDVEMPRMNGFELTASIRQDLGLLDMPVVIVTSLASDEHRRRGLEAGAQAYIVKSQFNQDNLLDAIAQLLGSERVAS